MKIQLGAHIDGFASISAETIVVGASAENPVTGRRADVIKAAYTAAEAAMRTLKVGNRNWAVTEIVARSADAFGCKPVEGNARSDCTGQTMNISSLQACFPASRPKTLSMARSVLSLTPAKAKNATLKLALSLRVKFTELTF